MQSTYLCVFQFTYPVVQFALPQISPDEDLPKTKTKKYIRVGLADKLGFGEEDVAEAPTKEMKAKIDWG